MRLKKLLFLLLILLISVLLIGCSQGSRKTVVTYVADDNVVAIIDFIDDEPQVEIPDVPEKAGYTGAWEEYELTLGNVTVNAVYTPIEYTVTFIADDVTVGADSYTVEDKEITEPEVPEKAGYTGIWEEYELTLGNVTVNAVYTPIEYTVTFMADGVTVGADSYTVEDKEITEPDVPEKAGYTGVWEEYELTLGNVTVNTVYTPIEYTVTFIADDVTVGADSYTVEDKEITEPEVPEKAGYTGAWEEYELTLGNVTVNAVYTPIEYTVTFIADDVTVGADSYTVEDKEITEPEVPEKAGYTGIWEEYELTLGNVTVNAVYTPKQYTVTTESNSNMGEVTPSNVYDYNSSVTITAKPYLGYKFVGWYSGEDFLTSDLQYTFTVPFYDCVFRAEFAVKEEMENFIFTADFNTCQITGVKDVSVLQINVPDYITGIECGAFIDCQSVIEIKLPLTQHLGYYFGTTSSFENNLYVPYSLQTVIINDIGQQSIPYHAFSGCEYLVDIVIPQNITSIDYGAFFGCTSLADIVIPNGVQNINSQAFYNCSGLTNIVIPDSVTSIGDDVFSGCSSLTSIIIPDGVTSIGYGVFSGCSSLTSIIIPDGVTSIGYGVFSGCSSLTEIVIPNSVRNIGDSAFSGCSSLTSINIPDGIRGIGEAVFFGCSSLTEIVIPDSVRIIGNYAFSGCSSLTSIILPNSIRNIGEKTFYNCSGLTNIVIPDSVTSIGDSAFSECSSLTDIVIPDGITSIGNSVFSGCSSLTRIVIPDGITSIGNSVFSGCSSLTRIVIPDGITSIGNSIFSGCSSLTEIVIPDSVTSIGYWAFYHCSNLMNIVIPDGVISIGDTAFSECSSLTEIVIPDSVTSIGNDVFSGCSSLTSIIIPDGVTSIGKSAFSGCSSLTKIVIPDGITSIGNSTFSDCSNLTDIVIPDGVTSIGEYAFWSCSNLKSIVLPDSIIRIEDSVFFGCDNLTSYYYKGTVEQWNAISVGNNNFYFAAATIYYYIENETDIPDDGGNYWHFADDGVTPVIWTKETI